MSNLLWLTEAQMARLRPFFPKSHGRRESTICVLSGTIVINRNGLRWCDAPKEYGPAKTLYNRWKRWSDNGVFARMMEGLASEAADRKTVMIDATYLKAHRTACSLRAQNGGRGKLIGRTKGFEGKRKLSSGQFRPRTEHQVACRHGRERPPDQVLHDSR